MMGPGTKTKRSYDDDSHDRRSKPRDWRDAFLQDSAPSGQPASSTSSRRDDRSRDPRIRDGDDKWVKGSAEGYASERDRRRDDQYSRDRNRYGSAYDPSRNGGRDHHDRDRSGHGRYHDRDVDTLRYDRDERDRRGHDHYDRRDDRRREPEREEGEYVELSNATIRMLMTRLETSPPRSKPHGSSRLDGRRVGFESTATEDRSVAQPEKPVVVVDEERDPEEVLAERRRKREEILAKYNSAQKEETVAATASSDPPTPATGSDSVVSGQLGPSGALTGTSTGGESANLSLNKDKVPTPGATSLLKQLGTKSITTSSAATPINPQPSFSSTPLGHEVDLSKHETSNVSKDEQGAGVSAADYDPTGDKKADEEKRQHDVEVIGGKPDAKKAEPSAPEEDEWEEVEVEEEEEDDDVDMFAAFGDDEAPKKKRKVMVRRRKGGDAAEAIQQKKKTVLDVVDNLDDTDGYYRITPGEILDDGRYQVTITLGKGMFSGVVKAKVLKAVGQERRQDVVGKEVAIKVIRSQESMYVAGRKEAQILKKLNDADPEDKKHIVRLENVFEHRGHLCIVTESLRWVLFLVPFALSPACDKC